jgi:hypothetical protein
MIPTEYLILKDTVIDRGYSNEIKWAEELKPCEDSFSFFIEYGWVVVNSGMKNQVAEKIWGRILDAITKEIPIFEVFKHRGKSAAIEYVWGNRYQLFKEWKAADDRLAFLQKLPWIGPITKWHLAKNLGEDVVKPDRHLVRVAEACGESPKSLCKKISEATGDRIALVDLVIWRACNLKIWERER